MKLVKYAWLVLQALFELARYDMVKALRGTANIDLRLGRKPITFASPNSDLLQRISDAVILAGCLYWRPVLCLQRSVCMVRLLRKHGIVAQLVIGYRVAPFFSHAWVEVDGCIVNDSPSYQKQLQVLYTA